MSRPWWELDALAFDTESTGLNTRIARIVTVALVRLGPSKPQAERYLINPGIPIPAEATAIHGITTEHAQANGAEPAVVLDTTAGALADALHRGIPVLGMNVPYDLTLLHFDCMRHGVETVSARLGGHDKVAPIVDAYVLDRTADKYRKGTRNLESLCKHYEVKHHGAHDSAYDALAAALVAAAAVKRSQMLNRLTLAELHTAQVAWKREQNTSLQQHFDRTHQDGNDRKVVEFGWPLYDSVTSGMQPC